MLFVEKKEKNHGYIDTMYHTCSIVNNDRFFLANAYQVRLVAQNGMKCISKENCSLRLKEIEATNSLSLLFQQGFKSADKFKVGCWCDIVVPVQFTQEFLWELPCGGVKLFTHGDAALFNFIIHFNVFQEARSNSLKGILRPSLCYIKQIIVQKLAVVSIYKL